MPRLQDKRFVESDHAVERAVDRCQNGLAKATADQRRIWRMAVRARLAAESRLGSWRNDRPVDEERAIPSSISYKCTMCGRRWVDRDGITGDECPCGETGLRLCA